MRTYVLILVLAWVAVLGLASTTAATSVVQSLNNRAHTLGNLQMELGK